MSAPEFIIVPYAVLTDGSISHAAKLTYGRLKFYAGEDGRAFPKHETLAREVCLQPRQLKNVLVELRAAGWISWTRARTSCIYTVHSDRQETADQIGKKLPMRQAENCLSRQARNCLQKRTIENHHQKRTENKKNPASVKPETACGAEGEAEKPKPISWKADDEAPATRAQLQNPEMELQARLAERHGDTVDASLLLHDIRKELNGVPLAEFLEADTKATTAPEDLRNPAGHYRTLARKIGNRKTTAALESVMATQEQGREFLKRGAPAPFKAPTCCNEGRLAGGQYCTCKVGDLRRQVDERKATHEAA